ncbi:MAG: LPS export ABC transporter permease LptG [Pseudomonadota bacterium]|nr:LPS export ABC transporter permease LptG [Pseudomonadota bacterium]MEC7830618.1 LPS export ABC transporter permease LptG [Pseudomonadota bacterium]MEC9382586.1 LPS export ABC transporter permease LptG [Pseudomonadota bacterium]MEC9414318.1 LPS export ABC transporter permease LptG [Pseudomonadota bacterium]MEC9481342.1 LPS export ABC transporter permease LptG [Pseudomonadota bacterium]
MKLTKTLTKYFYKKYVTTLFYTLLISVIFVLIVDTAELARRISKIGNGDIVLAFQLALLKLPEMLLEIFPFIVLFGSLATFYILSKNSELVIFRVSGISIWKFLAPAIIIVLFIGLILITAIQPFIALSSERFKELEARNIRGQLSLITLSENGLWLKEDNLEEKTYYIIHSLGMDRKGGKLEDVIFFKHHENGNLINRIDAASATLQNGEWSLIDTWIKEDDKSFYLKDFKIKTNLSSDQIQENFSPPETISLWSLPEFIAIAEKAGFASQRHKTRLYGLISFPFFLASMVLAAAPFSVNFLRTNKINFLLFGGLFIGLAAYTLSSVALAFGSSGSINPLLSAWVAPIITIMGSITILLYTEES